VKISSRKERKGHKDVVGAAGSLNLFVTAPAATLAEESGFAASATALRPLRSLRETNLSFYFPAFAGDFATMRAEVAA
jgi:hypothetical protein